jgi:hypothetical protein
MAAVGSLNADRRPDLRDAIIDDTFQITKCPSCGEDFRLAPVFTYLDVGNGQWIAALPADRLIDWQSAEDEAKESFNASYGPSVPASAREIAELLQVRLCFGWPAVREKIIVKAASLDDAIVEMMKLDLMRRLPNAPFGNGIELRIISADGPAFEMVWIDRESEEVQQRFSAQRALYDDIAAKAEAWATIRGRLTGGPFVDMQKLYYGADRDRTAPAA